MDQKITKIRIENLFGFLTHEVSLHEDGVTFIHGPNGCGKTSLLSLIAGFYSWDLTSLHEINFGSIEFFYGPDVVLKMTKHLEVKEFEEERVEVPYLTFQLLKNGSETERYEFHWHLKEVRISHSQIDEYVPFLHRIGPRMWIDARTDEKLTYNTVLERYAHRIPFSSKQKRPQWLHEFQENANLHFVQTQRLLKVVQEPRSRLTRDDQSVTQVIDLYSQEIRSTIQKTLAQSAAVSQSKDRSFPQRLLSLSLDQSLSEESIREDYSNTEMKIQKLMESGLIEQEKNISLPDKEFEATEKKVLSLYLQDINEKYAVFDDLLRRVQTFLDIVSPKLRNKTFRVSKDHGFLIETTQGDPQKLSPSLLSSGEQHQIVLFYELIFKTSDNSFFLIDEPEISLHIDWQRQFLSDISKIASLGSHSFLVATHSPQIVGGRRDLAIALDGGILNE